MHIIGISQVYLVHITDISQVYPRYILCTFVYSSGIPQAYLRYIFVIYQT